MRTTRRKGFEWEDDMVVLIEGDHRLRQAPVEGVACPSQLDLDSAAVDRVAPALDKPGLLEPVEVAGHRRAFDADRAG